MLNLKISFKKVLKIIKKIEPGKAKAWVVVVLPMGTRQGGLCRCLRSAHRRTVEWSICILQDPILVACF